MPGRDATAATLAFELASNIAENLIKEQWTGARKALVTEHTQQHVYLFIHYSLICPLLQP